MTPLKERLELATAFDERTLEKLNITANSNKGQGTIGQLDRDWLSTILFDYQRLQPILAALIECVEALEPLTNAGLARITPLGSQVEKAFEALANLEKVIG